MVHSRKSQRSHQGRVHINCTSVDIFCFVVVEEDGKHTNIRKSLSLSIDGSNGLHSFPHHVLRSKMLYMGTVKRIPHLTDIHTMTLVYAFCVRTLDLYHTFGTSAFTIVCQFKCIRSFIRTCGQAYPFECVPCTSAELHFHLFLVFFLRNHSVCAFKEITNQTFIILSSVNRRISDQMGHSYSQNNSKIYN